MLTSSNIDDSLKLIGKRPHRTVQQYDLDGRFVAEYDSISDAVAKTGINKFNISKCCNHKQATAKGFIFRFSDDDEQQIQKKD